MRKYENLSRYKRGALSWGTDMKPFSGYENVACLWATDFPSGKFMEIVVSWMLGYFRSFSGLYMYVEISERLDRKEACDFLVKTRDLGEEPEAIDMKFDKLQSADVADVNQDHVVVRLFPERKGRSGKTETGEQALRKVLLCMYDGNTVKKALSGADLFLREINSVWSRTTRGW